jgi:hypothetical protein
MSKQLTINAVNHGTRVADKNRYCGPSAISAVTGMTTAEAAKLLRVVSGARLIKGTHIAWMRDALRECGIKMGEDIRAARRGDSLRVPAQVYPYLEGDYTETLARWLSNTRLILEANRWPWQEFAQRVFLVVAGNHWQLIQGDKYVCGLTGEVVSVTDKRVKRRAKVTQVYELTLESELTIPDYAKRKPKSKSTPNYSYLIKKLQKQHPELGMEYEVEYYGPPREYEVTVAGYLEDWAREDGPMLTAYMRAYGLQGVYEIMQEIIKDARRDFPDEESLERMRKCYAVGDGLAYWRYIEGDKECA